MKIAHRPIGPEHPPLVVAEIGINHGGSLDVAKAMVTAAHRAGCEMVKHQTHFVEDEMTEEAQSIFPPNADVSIWEVMRRCALSPEHEIELKRHTEALGMIYISTPSRAPRQTSCTTSACRPSRSARASATTCPSSDTSRASASR